MRSTRGVRNLETVGPGLLKRMFLVMFAAALLTWAREATLALLAADFSAYYERYASGETAIAQEWMTTATPDWIDFPTVSDAAHYAPVPDQAGREWTVQKSDGDLLGTITREATENLPVRRVLFSVKDPDGRPAYAVLFRLEPAGEHHTRISVSCRRPGTAYQLLFDRTEKQDLLSALCSGALQKVIAAVERAQPGL